MIAAAESKRLSLPTVAGVGVGLAGCAFAGVGLWARREVRRALIEERVTGTETAASPIASAAQARAMAELVRRNTVAATGGRTYAEVDPFVTAAGNATADAAEAARDALTNEPLENPEHALWVQSLTLQTALMQAYMAFRLAELTVALGAALAFSGVGVVASGRRGPR